ncbi:hypothetical protein LshimejAT787_0409180 [Lyophyllum shimeji]|uniref:Uncharacterized protein n=1 Tax=Lyophyllum shimeji TaxID=47721 RepID=A0A9P3PKD3_LYOSH|nr:hypothetical protein LshimejAT787_0409180 [Lyophyllum shimeji]
MWWVELSSPGVIIDCDGPLDECRWTRGLVSRTKSLCFQGVGIIALQDRASTTLRFWRLFLSYNPPNGSIGHPSKQADAASFCLVRSNLAIMDDYLDSTPNTSHPAPDHLFPARLYNPCIPKRVALSGPESAPKNWPSSVRQLQVLSPIDTDHIAVSGCLPRCVVPSALLEVGKICIRSTEGLTVVAVSVLYCFAPGIINKMRWNLNQIMSGEDEDRAWLLRAVSIQSSRRRTFAPRRSRTPSLSIRLGIAHTVLILAYSVRLARNRQRFVPVDEDEAAAWLKLACSCEISPFL